MALKRLFAVCCAHMLRNTANGSAMLLYQAYILFSSVQYEQVFCTI